MANPYEGDAGDEDIEIRAVLDTTATLSYARGHVHIGELLVDIADEGAYTGLPALVLLDAHSQVLDNQQVFDRAFDEAHDRIEAPRKRVVGTAGFDKAERPQVQSALPVLLVACDLDRHLDQRGHGRVGPDLARQRARGCGPRAGRGRDDLVR